MIMFLLLILFIPFNVKAASIEYTWITGTNEKTAGEEFSLSFGIKVSGIQKGNWDSLGILAVSYELIFDDTVFTITDISSRIWNSEIYKEDGKYYVVSSISENDPYKNKCVDGISYCADYLVTISFYVLDTEQTSSVIKMGEVGVGLLGMIDSNSTYTEDDIVTITTMSNESQTIKIKKTESPKNDVPTSIVSDTKPEINNQEIINKGQESNTIQKSNNKYLKSLQIENHKINFNKTKNNYDITVNKSVNELKLNIELEDSKATYKIIGADNLEKNNHQVLIEVTAENGEKNTYTINVKEKEETIIQEENKSQNKKSKKFQLDKKYIIIGSVIGGIILFLIIIIRIIIHRKDRKLERAIDEL